MKLDPLRKTLINFVISYVVYSLKLQKIDVCKIKESPNSKFKQKVTTVKPWFDNECKHERDEYIKSVDSALQLKEAGKSTKSLLTLKIRFIVNSCLTE